MWKELEVSGKPGDLCVILKNSQLHNGQPVKGLAWGPFDRHGRYKMLLNTDDQEEVTIVVYEPHMAEQLEKWWHLNTEE
jgi:hypothetical protein